MEGCGTISEQCEGTNLALTDLASTNLALKEGRREGESASAWAALKEGRDTCAVGLICVLCVHACVYVRACVRPPNVCTSRQVVRECPLPKRQMLFLALVLHYLFERPYRTYLLGWAEGFLHLGLSIYLGNEGTYIVLFWTN